MQFEKRVGGYLTRIWMKLEEESFESWTEAAERKEREKVVEELELKDLHVNLGKGGNGIERLMMQGKLNSEKQKVQFEKRANLDTVYHDFCLLVTKAGDTGQETVLEEATGGYKPGTLVYKGISFQNIVDWADTGANRPDPVCGAREAAGAAGGPALGARRVWVPGPGLLAPVRRRLL